MPRRRSSSKPDTQTLGLPFGEPRVAAAPAVAPVTLVPPPEPDIRAGIGSLERWAACAGYCRVGGADEVGRGPLAGPVVAAVVVLPAGHGIEGLADSKQLTALQREALAEQISRLASAWGLGVVSAEGIDATNIRLASLKAMSLALAEVLLQGVVPGLVLVDGRDEFPHPEGFPPVLQRAFIKGDSRSEAVAAASIVAKVYRDALMQEYHALWPEYGFDQHKGYPTEAHKQAILKHGPCEIHRKTFRGVRCE
jgi:ribonuclease HII